MEELLAEGKRFIDFLKKWMLPIAMAGGVSLSLALHFVPFLKPLENSVDSFSAEIQPTLICIMLFLQFIKVSPSDLSFHRWHAILLGIQAFLFAAMALFAVMTKGSEASILFESAMICFICPTAAAAGVITMRLGGDMAQTITYVILDNLMAALLIPCVIPFVNPVEGFNFFGSFLRILARVFSILILPSILAWGIRYFWKRLHAFLMRYVGWAFYVWGIALFFSLTLATKALIISGISYAIFIALGLISLVCCLIQFALGRRLGGKYYNHAVAITAGQSLGQKNSGFIVWLGFNFLTPVSSAAGGLYSIWQNIVNQYQLYQAAKRKAKTTV